MNYEVNGFIYIKHGDSVGQAVDYLLNEFEGVVFNRIEKREDETAIDFSLVYEAVNEQAVENLCIHAIQLEFDIDNYVIARRN